MTTRRTTGPAIMSLALAALMSLPGDAHTQPCDVTHSGSFSPPAIGAQEGGSLLPSPYQLVWAVTRNPNPIRTCR